jgi:L-lactate dehydrogenase complex protein LldG
MPHRAAPTEPSPATEQLVAQFTERVRALGGTVWLAPGGRADVRRRIVEAVRELTGDRSSEGGVPHVVVWATDELGSLELPGLLAELGTEYVPWRPSAEPLAIARARLREASATSVLGITTCAWAVAETGTLALYATAGTGRLPSLLPPAHLCLVRPGQIVQGVPEGLRLLSAYAAEHGGLPSTVNLVSGPSRSADIEGDISIGVHGPGRLGVVIGDW